MLGNVTGGARRGADYDGLTQAILQMDTQRAFGWYGGLFNISALQIHGRNLSDRQSADRCKPPAGSRRTAPPACGNFGISRSFSTRTGST